MHGAHLTALSLPAGAHLRRSVWPAAGLRVAAHLPKGSLQALPSAQSTRPQHRSLGPARLAWPPRTPSSRSRSMNGCTSRRRRQSGRPCHHSGAFVAVGGSRAARSGLGHCGTLLRFGGSETPLPPSRWRRISGTFTLGEIHSWVSACLPGVPARLQGERGEFAFRNLLVGTLLLCDYGPGEPAVMAGREGAAPHSRLPVSRGRRLCLRLAHDPRHCQGGARQGSDCA